MSAYYQNTGKFFTLALVSLLHCSVAQQTQVVLDQGALVGLKIFPDSARTAVYAFLGLPYARPPVGELRFAPPQPHTGWNWTLQAMSMKPICPQLTNTIYDETADGTLARAAAMDEDCLYLNVWVPEAGMRFGQLPVLIMLTGEEMSYDWPRNRPTGLDFAAEGAVVVSVQYRSNIFGWIGMNTPELAGNYGLLDQQLALQWVQHNIQHFGGNPKEVTLLGHGTMGAPCALAHALNTHQEQLFSRLILMSGGDFEAALQTSAALAESSRVLVQKLGCQFEERPTQVVTCLRMKSVSDLLKAFESGYDHGNGTLQLGPIVTTNLQEFAKNRTLLVSLPPILVGVTSNEGAFLQDYWLDLARDYRSIRAYVNYTVLPNVLRRVGYNAATANQQVVDTLNWRYFNGEAMSSAAHLLRAMQRLKSESYFETPFYRVLEKLSGDSDGATTTVYAYLLDASNSMDMRGKTNLFGGASHSSDLPLLLGPSLFQQISRRRFTADEEKLCRKLRTAFINFVKSGNPTPGRIYDAWLPYTRTRKFIFNLGEVSKGESEQQASAGALMTFEQNLPQIEKLFAIERVNVAGVGLSRSNRNEYSNPYQLSADANDARRTKSTNYLTNQQDSGYALHLQRIYGFWHVLLPNMVAYGGADEGYEGISTALGQRIRLIEATADAMRYKRGFFAMLGLVAVLLAILGLCVYLLRRDPLHIATHSSSFCL